MEKVPFLACAYAYAYAYATPVLTYFSYAYVYAYACAYTVNGLNPGVSVVRQQLPAPYKRLIHDRNETDKRTSNRPT